MAGLFDLLGNVKNRIFPPVIAPIAGYQPTRFEYLDRPNLPTVAPPDKTPTPTPSPSPTPRPMPPGSFQTEPYRVSGDYQLPTPPPDIAKLLWDIFPHEATKAAIMLGTENPRFDPNAYNFNTNQTGDYGMAQINSATLADFLRRMPNRTRNTGVSSVEDLRDVVKNLTMAKLIRDVQGWGAWYGPGNRGFDIVGR